MCNVTLSYNENNALAVDDAAKEAYRKEVEEFLYGSKILAAKAFAKHL
jgi:hypothetical protein